MCLNMYSIFQGEQSKIHRISVQESSFDSYDGVGYMLPDWGPAEKGETEDDMIGWHH